MHELSEVAEIRVLHRDAQLLVLDKPAGLLSVPGRGADKADCLSARVQAVFPDALVVHRLDMATSGLIVMARGADTQRRLSRAFAEREVSKRYVAVVHRPFGDDTDLDAIAERIVAVGGVGVWFMPRDQIWIGAPVGFFAVKALEHFRVRRFIRAQIDMRSFVTLRAAVGDLVNIAQNH